MMLNWPVPVPADDGENVPLTTHVLPGVTVPQVVVSEKSPVGVTPETVRFAVPVFVTTIGRLPEFVPTGWFPKLTLVTLRLIAGAVAMPVPESVVLCGLPEALSVTTIEAGREPEVVGLNSTGIRQLCPACKGDEQALAKRM